MAAISFGDELVKDYLLYRGFMGTLKAFDGEIKADKDKGFRPDRIVDHLSACIGTLDLAALKDAWSHLDHRVFSRLEHSFLATAKKLENALLRMYVVTCVTSGRQDKLLEFFEKMTPELQGHAEWKDWFALPFLKNPEDSPTFQVYFTRQWQDTMLVSLHNFISVVFQSMAMPTLLNYEEEIFRLSALQDENEALRQRLSSGECDVGKAVPDSGNQEIPAPPELMDDFCVIAQEAPSSESQSKSIRTLIRNFSSGLPTSPILGRRHQGQNGSRKQSTEDTSGVRSSKVKPRSPSVPPQVSNACSPSLTSSGRLKHAVDQEHGRRMHNHGKEDGSLHGASLSSDAVNATRASISSQSSPSALDQGADQKGAFLILSQEEYVEHHSCITHCKFNTSGSVVASADMDGVIKLWTPCPSPHTLSTIMSKSSVLSLEWASKRERLLLYGNMAGRIRVYDTKDRKVVGDISHESSSLLRNQRIMCLACSPTETHFVCSTNSSSHRHPSKGDTFSSPQQGKLLLWDMRTLQLERQLQLETPTVVNSCAFNHNGQLLVVGTSDGKVFMFDMHTCKSIATWKAHASEVFSLQFSTDETACYTMGGDGKFIQWSVCKTEEKVAELAIHAGATGPFAVGGNSNVPHHYPVGKLFAFDTDGSHVLTCGPAGGIIYKMTSGGVHPVLNLGSHKWPVDTVDWSTAMDCGACLTGSLDGRIMVSTLLPL